MIRCFYSSEAGPLSMKLRFMVLWEYPVGPMGGIL